MGKCREKRKRKRQRKKETKKLVKKEWKKEQQKDRQIDQTKKKKEKCNQSVIGYWRQEFPCLKLSEGHYCNSSHGTTMHSKSRAGPIVLCQEKSVETQSSERIFLCPSLPVSLCVAVFPTPPSPSASLGFSQAKKKWKDSCRSDIIDVFSKQFSSKTNVLLLQGDWERNSHKLLRHYGDAGKKNVWRVSAWNATSKLAGY